MPSTDHSVAVPERHVSSAMSGIRTRLPVLLILSVAIALFAPWPGRPGTSAGRLAVAWAAPPVYEGFGASTPGGSGQPVVHVTTLNNSGAGSLRAALSQGNRTIVFDIGGTIQLTSALQVNGAFVTIDGFTAPAPGITLYGGALVLRGDHGVHDVIVRGIRVRDAPLDGIQVSNGAYNVVIDHVSVHGSGDGNIDITETSHDVTVSWSILDAPASKKNMLIKYHANRLSLHHNLFSRSEQRNPTVSTDDAGTPDTDTTVDIRNNVVWDWGFGTGILILKGARANVVANFTSSPGSLHLDQTQGILVCNLDCDGDLTALALAHVSGNLSGDPIGIDMNTEGNVLDPWPAPAVTTQNAYAAAQEVLANVGARPLDAVDQQLLAGIVLSPPPDGPNLSVSFLAVGTGGSGLVITARTTNGGTQPAGASPTRFFLSPDPGLDAMDTLLASRSVGPLDPDASSVESFTVPVPPGIVNGTSYVVIARADDDDALVETYETDNVFARTVFIFLPDLTVSDLTVPLAAAAGTAIQVSDTTANESAAAATTGTGTTTRFFLSVDATLDPGDVPIGSRPVPDLAGNSSNRQTTTVMIPGGTSGGPYYILAYADAAGVLTELSDTNNVTSQPITIGGPELVIQSLSAPAAVKPGATIAISDTTRNLGSLAASTTTKYYLSSDAVWSSNDVLLGSRTVPDLGPGAMSSGSASVAIPSSTASGTYFVIARADANGAVGETDETNNTLARAVEVGLDLLVSAVSAPTWVSAGATIEAGDTTKNRGSGAAPGSTTAFFVSASSSLAPDAVRSGSRAVPPLASGANSTGSAPVTIPPGLGGDFFIIALANADAGIIGGDGSNNAKSRAIRVGPDLSVTGLNSPASARAGDHITVVDITRNSALVDAPASTMWYYLSPKSSLDGEAVHIGERGVPALVAGHSHTNSGPIILPAGTPPGKYFVIVKSDGPNVITEYNEGNNTRSRAITIKSP